MWLCLSLCSFFLVSFFFLPAFWRGDSIEAKVRRLTFILDNGLVITFLKHDIEFVSNL